MKDANTNSSPIRTRTRRMGVAVPLLVAATGISACNSVPTSKEILYGFTGIIVLDGAAYDAARVVADDGQREVTATTNAQGEFTLAVPAGTFDLRIEGTPAICQSGEVVIGGDTRVDIACIRPNGQIQALFEDNGNTCGLPGFQPIQLPYDVLANPGTGGMLNIEFQTQGGQPIVGQYDDASKQYVGSSAPFTDANGTTATETWNATVNAPIGGSTAKLVGVSDILLVSGQGATCRAQATLTVSMVF